MTTRRHQSHNPMGPARNLPPKSYRTQPLLTNILTWDEQSSHGTNTQQHSPMITTQPTKNPSPTTHPHQLNPHNHTNNHSRDTNQTPTQNGESTTSPQYEPQSKAGITQTDTTPQTTTLTATHSPTHSPITSTPATHSPNDSSKPNGTPTTEA